MARTKPSRPLGVPRPLSLCFVAVGLCRGRPPAQSTVQAVSLWGPDTTELFVCPLPWGSFVLPCRPRPRVADGTYVPSSRAVAMGSQWSRLASHRLAGRWGRLLPAGPCTLLAGPAAVPPCPPAVCPWLVAPLGQPRHLWTPQVQVFVLGFSFLSRSGNIFNSFTFPECSYF